MAKFTDTQLIVLSAAAARGDGIAVVPVQMNKAAALKVGASLITRKLMRELRSKPGMPVWRQSEEGRPISLIITRGGRDAIGVQDDVTAQRHHLSNAPLRGAEAWALEKRSRDASGGKDSNEGGPPSPRAGTKQARVIEMLCAKNGATLDTLIGATGWLPHTTRAALTGLRKGGFSIERSREEGCDSIYRIVSLPTAAAA